jgi:hypothetical protein
MPHVDAVVFDLFETLVTEYDPHWKPGPSIASRLGVSDEVFRRVWRSRYAERMTSVVDFRDVLRNVHAAGKSEAGATDPTSQWSRLSRPCTPSDWLPRPRRS